MSVHSYHFGTCSTTAAEEWVPMLLDLIYSCKTNTAIVMFGYRSANKWLWYKCECKYIKLDVMN